AAVSGRRAAAAARRTPRPAAPTAAPTPATSAPARLAAAGPPEGGPRRAATARRGPCPNPAPDRREGTPPSTASSRRRRLLRRGHQRLAALDGRGRPPLRARRDRILQRLDDHHVDLYANRRHQDTSREHGPGGPPRTTGRIIAAGSVPAPAAPSAAAG